MDGPPDHGPSDYTTTCRRGVNTVPRTGYAYRFSAEGQTCPASPAVSVLGDLLVPCPDLGGPSLIPPQASSERADGRTSEKKKMKSRRGKEIWEGGGIDEIWKEGGRKKEV